MIRNNFSSFHAFKIGGKTFLALGNGQQTDIYSQGDGKIDFYGAYFNEASFRKYYEKEGEKLKL